MNTFNNITLKTGITDAAIRSIRFNLCRYSLASVLALGSLAIPAMAQDTNQEVSQEVEQGTSQQVEQEQPMDPAMAESIERYKGCIEGVMSTQESSADKREQIVSQCEGYHQDMAEFFAPEVREFVMTNNNRRIAVVLDALEAMEAVVDDSVEDSEIITSEISDEDMGEAVETTASTDS